MFGICCICLVLGRATRRKAPGGRNADTSSPPGTFAKKSDAACERAGEAKLRWCSPPHAISCLCLSLSSTSSLCKRLLGTETSHLCQTETLFCVTPPLAPPMTFLFLGRLGCCLDSPGDAVCARIGSRTPLGDHRGLKSIAPPATPSRVGLLCVVAGRLDTGGRLLPDSGLPDKDLPDVGLLGNGLPDSGLPDNGLPDNGLPDDGLMPPLLTALPRLGARLGGSFTDIPYF
mmetsp:Transcript_71562/g.126909  ORF Transcript_71562/g.126909 Transcript_71562/m.126909 type:complete len:231 (-) Transcript_71562:224-916(-)